MTRRLRLLAAVVISAAAWALPVQTATAAEACGELATCTTHYYSDATKTTLVGAYRVHCGGHVTQYGQVTIYKNFYVQPCY